MQQRIGQHISFRWQETLHSRAGNTGRADFYTNRDPSKIGNVDNILAQFGPAQIRQILMQKYGETIVATGGRPQQQQGGAAAGDNEPISRQQLADFYTIIVIMSMPHVNALKVAGFQHISCM